MQAGGPPPKRKVEYGTGIVVSPDGHIVTDRQVIDGCNVIVISGYGNADTQAEDKTTDLALIRVYGAPDLVPVALNSDGAKGPDLTLVGIADPQNQGGGSAISTASAQLRGDALEPAPQRGFSGAAALDGQGQFVGMAELKAQVVASIGEPRPRKRRRPLCRCRRSEVFSTPSTSSPRPAQQRRGSDQELAGAGDLLCGSDRSVVGYYLFLNLGGRFSTNAVMPSR